MAQALQAFMASQLRAEDAAAFEGSRSACAFPAQEDAPRTGPDVVVARTAYTSRALQHYLRKRRARAVTPSRPAWPLTVTAGGTAGTGRRHAKQRNPVPGGVSTALNRGEGESAYGHPYEKPAATHVAGLRIAGVFLRSARCPNGIT
ncbi:hypothetical protein ACFVW9_24465 [Streptomyces sp. NPDC058217]|uniref:hypothetical protein n=1 Tax=Streptomyces sp. NPDC058217 TaxID=3346384 RepID=UPI0036EA65B5